MQIHELNNFAGSLGSGAYLAIDDGNDTGKISSQGLLAATEARIDNIIAGPAPSAEEIVDARLGDDGVTYPSLGDAIRDQFSDVKSAIGDTTGNVIIPMIAGAYINLSGATADVNNPTPTSSPVQYAVVQCTAGDIFTINTVGGYGARAYGFVDSNGTILKVSGESYIMVNEEVKAPANSAWLVINNNVATVTPSYKSRLLKLRLNDAEEATSLLKGYVSDVYNGDIYFDEVVKGEYVNQYTGAFGIDSGDMRTGFIAIPTGAKSIRFTSAVFTQYNCFYDENKSRISAFSLNVGETSVTVPPTAKYFAVSCSATSFSLLKASVPNAITLGEAQLKLQEIETNISDTNDELDKFENSVVVISANRYDRNSATPHMYMSQYGENIGDDYNRWFSSAPILVSGATKLQSNIPLNSVIFINEDDTYDTSNSQSLLYNTVTLPVTIPPTAKALRVSSMMTNYNSAIMLNFGDNLLPYEPYGMKLVDSLLKDNPKASAVNYRTTETNFLQNCKQALKKNVIVSYFATFDTFTSLKIGFTKSDDYENDYTDYIEITNSSCILHRKGYSDITWQHGMALADYIGVNISFDFSMQFKIKIGTNGDSFTFSNYFYLGSSYYPFSILDASNASNKALSFSCSDMKRNVMLFGDSYVSNGSSRWVYYLPTETINNICINGYSGEASTDAIVDFDTMINMGAPKYVLWCLGMNDGSDTDDSTPSASWLSNIQSVIGICEEKNIVPILATIPSVPNINNRAKSAWVRASGYHFIDFAKAVEADNNGNWYSGMLSTDNVHPTDEGAKALCSKALADFPQLLVASN